MDQLALVLALLLGAVVTVPLGEKLDLPAPVQMTLAGIGLAFVPFVPNVEIPPDFILPLVLPPLLYATCSAPPGASSRPTSGRSCCSRWPWSS